MEIETAHSARTFGNYWHVTRSHAPSSAERTKGSGRSSDLTIDIFRARGLTSSGSEKSTTTSFCALHAIWKRKADSALESRLQCTTAAPQGERPMIDTRQLEAFDDGLLRI
jgi:hypothetical protein